MKWGKIINWGKIIILLCSYSMPAYSANQDVQTIIVASTTSTDNSGFLNYIIPLFFKEKNIKIKALIQGTGQAIKSAQNGDVDVLFVHHKPSEKSFIKNGFGVKRYNVMYNDFILVGSNENKANIKFNDSIVEAFGKIKNKKALFISRADDSGTNKKEISIWGKINFYALAQTQLKENKKNKWYVQAGAGMGATLNIAVAKNAYTLSDRATWLAFENKGDLKIVTQGDKQLFNQYGLIAINPKKHKHTNIKAANIFIRWMLSARGQKYIAQFKIKGKQAFFPNAKN